MFPLVFGLQEFINHEAGSVRSFLTFLESEFAFGILQFVSELSFCFFFFFLSQLGLQFLPEFPLFFADDSLFFLLFVCSCEETLTIVLCLLSRPGVACWW